MRQWPHVARSSMSSANKFPCYFYLLDTYFWLGREKCSSSHLSLTFPSEKELGTLKSIYCLLCCNTIIFGSMSLIHNQAVHIHILCHWAWQAFFSHSATLGGCAGFCSQKWFFLSFYSNYTLVTEELTRMGALVLVVQMFINSCTSLRGETHSKLGIKFLGQ